MSTYYDKSQYSQEFDNKDGSGWPYCNLVANVNGFIYANPKGITFGNHIKNFIEPCAGAHYYAQGYFTNNYQSASMTVNLSEVEIDRKDKRNGYIC